MLDTLLSGEKKDAVNLMGPSMQDIEVMNSFRSSTEKSFDDISYVQTNNYIKQLRPVARSKKIVIKTPIESVKNNSSISP